jgi:purine-nucleoside phosphorylase
MINRINSAVEYIKTKTDRTPSIAAVLGSGLGIYVEKLEDKIIIPYSDIPGFHQTTVAGHEGQLVFGKTNGIDVLIMQGRYHVYEGHELSEVVFPIRVMGALGIKNLILTNASGGINSDYNPGDLVIIEDQINMTGKNPLVGKNIDDLGPRFPDMTEVFNKALISNIKEAYNQMNLKAQTGTYMGVLGPSYETPAEIKMLRVLGGDLVGMSTVHEAISANHMGINVAGISRRNLGLYGWSQKWV